MSAAIYLCISPAGGADIASAVCLPPACAESSLYVYIYTVLSLSLSGSPDLYRYRYIDIDIDIFTYMYTYLWLKITCWRRG